jgi:hypothetical protein
MRNKLFLFFVLSSALLIISSCKKKDDDNSGANNQSISASVNGTELSYTGSSIGENTLSSGGYYPQYSYGFTGSANGTSITFYVQGTGTGTYAYGLTTYSPSLQITEGNVIYYSSKGGIATKGSIIITSVNGTTITGTFTGVLYNSTAADSVVVTNGQFSNLTY